MKKIYKFLFILIFVISSFLFINDVKADYEAIVVNPAGSKCELYSKATGKCFYKNENINSYVSGVVWFDTGDKVTVVEGKQTIPTKNTKYCKDHYVYVKYIFPQNNNTYYGYFCNDALINPDTALTEELKIEFQNAKFPSSYWKSLAVMKSAHPNWSFVAINTNLDWNYVVDVESSVGLSFIQGDQGYRSTLGGSYDYYTDTFTIMEGSDWYAANKETVAHYMDPRNFLNDMYIFQFESLQSNPDIQTLEGVRSILGDNFLKDYATDFIAAATDSGVSSIYLSALAFQETSGGGVAVNGTGFTYSIYNKKYPSLKGKWINGGFYNVYNIGAGTDKSPAQNSVVYAMGGADGTDTSFDRPWDSIPKAIKGGAKFIGDKYITKGQYSSYLKKFNVVSTYWDLFSHQYQTAIIAPSTESKKVFKSYYNMGILDSSFVFSIPVYNNMPEIASALPNQGNPNNYLNSLKVNNINIEGFDGAKTDYKYHVSYDVKSIDITASTVNSNATIINTGAKDLVVGDNNFEIKVIAQNGAEKIYNLNIVRSKNTSGEPTVDEIVSNSDIKSDGTYFGGFELDTKAQTLIDKIKSLNPDAIVKITDPNGSIKTNNSLATGDNVSITSAGEEKKYVVVISGDTSGNGKIDPLDLLKVQKHILDVNSLSGAYFKAADVNKDGKINPLDLLIIQKHILEVSFIKQ